MTYPNQVVILCGGRGSRLGHLTDNCPKCLLTVGRRPFLDMIIEHYKCNGLTEVILLAGYLGEQIQKAYQDWGKFRNVNIKVFMTEPDGTLTALRNAYEAGILDPDFILANGDTYPTFSTKLLTADVEPPTIIRAWCGNRDSGVRRFINVPLSNYPGTSIEEDLFTAIDVFNIDAGGTFIDIGTPADYEKAKVIFR